MKLLTFTLEGEMRLGAMLDGGQVIDLSKVWASAAHPHQATVPPASVMDVIALGDQALGALRFLIDNARKEKEFLLPVDNIDFAAPIPFPRKNIFCVGRNYKAHIIEGNVARGRDPNDFPKALELFTKPPTAVVGHKAVVSRHADITDLLDYEVELAIVIGKLGRDIPVERAYEHVFGYTIVNDITARDLQARHGQWFKGKSLDGTCPIGPVVVLKSVIDDPNNLNLSLSVNGEVRQSANTSDMLFDVAHVISEVSAGMTLEPGDIIATGTPSGVGLALTPPRSLQPGDVLSARIDHIGELVTIIS